MKFTEKLRRKAKNNPGERTPVIAFLGDSVTQGCFEVYQQEDMVKAVFDSSAGYPERVKSILSLLYPTAPVSVVNAGIDGGTAQGGLKRFERDVLFCNPDLLVVCFGLNDSNGEEKGIEAYKNALKQIFQKGKEAGMEIIFMTPNMLNTHTSRKIAGEICRTLSDTFAGRQRNGVFDAYMEAAREACREEQVLLCDCYALWKKMYEKGVDTTELLANGLNHPVQRMHELFAWQLVDTILKEE